MANTSLSNLVNIPVMADLVEKKYTDKIRFSPLCEIDNTLAGKPGDTLCFPVYSYIGDAATLAENSAVTPVALQQTSTSATVVKIAKAVTLSDEVILSGGAGGKSPVEETADQLAVALASAVDNLVLSVLNSITGTMVYSTSASTAELAPADILKALEKFGEDIDDGTNVVVVSPALYNQLLSTGSWLPASEIAADRLVKGAVGEAYGCQVIISNKLTTPGTAYIVKPGALRICQKRDILIESQRDLEYFRTLFAGSTHCVGYLYDSSKAIKLMKHA